MLIIRIYQKHPFPGDSAWKKYITKVITKYIKPLSRANVSGICYVIFTINKDGSISDIEALNMDKTLLAEVSIDAIKNGPAWIPAKNKGKSLKARRIQPISFVIQSD